MAELSPKVRSMTIIPFTRHRGLAVFDDKPPQTDSTPCDNPVAALESSAQNSTAKTDPVSADIDEGSTEAPCRKFASISKIAVSIWADPAPVVALCFMSAKVLGRSGSQLPRPLAALLLEHVRRGDPAAKLVADWLVRRGCLAAADVSNAAPVPVIAAPICERAALEARSDHAGVDTMEADHDA